MTFCLFRRLFQPMWSGYPHYLVSAGALMAAGIVAVAPAFALNSTSGLETSMFSFFIVLGVFVDTMEEFRGQWLGATVAFCLAILTRPEACLLFGVYWSAKVCLLIFSIFTSRRNVSLSSLLRGLYECRHFCLQIWSALAVTGVIIAQEAFRLLSYDGEWLPNTYYAKLGGLGSTAWQYVSDGLLSPVFGSFGLAVSLMGYCLARDRLSRNIFPFAVLTLTCSSLPFITGTDYMLGRRLAIPYLPFVAVLVAGGWIGMLLKTPRITLWMVVAVLAVGLTALWFMHDENRKGYHAVVTIRASGYHTGHTAMANWIETEAKKGDAVALMDIGIVGYLCFDQFILDLTGLTDRFIAKSSGGFLYKSYDPKYILDREPEFIVLTLTAPGRSYQVPPPDTSFGFWTPMERKLAQAPEFQRQYVRKRSELTPASNWLDSLAGSIGAEAIFEHAYPGRYYLLAVFRRNEEPRVRTNAAAGTG